MGYVLAQRTCAPIPLGLLLTRSSCTPSTRAALISSYTMRELSPAARLTLQELADRPAATFKQRLALLQFQIVVLLILYVVVRVMLKIPWLGRGLSKVGKLSRQGPLYKLGVWLCRRLARVTMGRHAYTKPICAPAVRIKKRTATAIEVKVVACVEIKQCVGCSWFRRAVRNRHRDAIEQVSR